MNKLITSWTGSFPVTTSAFALPKGLEEAAGAWADMDRATFLDLKAARKTQRLYREKGRRGFKPLTGYRKGQEK